MTTGWLICFCLESDDSGSQDSAPIYRCPLEMSICQKQHCAAFTRTLGSRWLKIVNLNRDEKIDEAEHLTLLA
jgi:hypothetical protein